MSTRNPWEPEPHRFVVEELLDLFPVVRSPNNHAPPAPTRWKSSIRLRQGSGEESRGTRERKDDDEEMYKLHQLILCAMRLLIALNSWRYGKGASREVLRDLMGELNAAKRERLMVAGA